MAELRYKSAILEGDREKKMMYRRKGIVFLLMITLLFQLLMPMTVMQANTILEKEGEIKQDKMKDFELSPECISDNGVSGSGVSNNGVSDNNPGQEKPGGDGSGDPEKTPDTDDDGNAEQPLRVLFIGNSFTQNGATAQGRAIETQLKGMAEQMGDNIEITTLAHGAAKLTYYAGMRNAKVSYYEELKKYLWGKTYDYVVLQENSIVPAYTLQTEMLPALTSLNTMITTLQPQATILLYQTHGYRYKDGHGNVLSPEKLQTKVAVGYHVAGIKNNLEVVPAGMHFSRARKFLPNVQFFEKDAKHPNANGSYVLAACFYYRFFGRSAIVDTSLMKGVTMTNEEAALVSLLPKDGLVADKVQQRVKLGKTAKMKVKTKAGLLPDGLTYRSNNTKVVKVEEKTGKMTAVGYGTTVVIAEDITGCQAYCMVTVPRYLRFSRESYQVGVGDRICIKPTGDAQDIVWKSGNKHVARVDKEGFVIAKKAGVVKIRATNVENENDNASYTLYVSCARVENVQASTTETKSGNKNRVSIKLTWDKSGGANAYYVYRAEKKNGIYKRIAKVKERQYIDEKALANTKYYYKVQAIVKKIPQCAGMMSTPVLGEVVAISSLKAAKKGTSLVLSWNTNREASGYVVYRAKKKDGKYVCLTVINRRGTTKFTDKTREKKKKYYYKVVPYRGTKKAPVYGRASIIYG